MIDHDKNVGQMLDYLDELGIAEDTFVQYSTDNGPHRNSWPDGGMTPFRSEKNTNWEGAFRIPLLVRWPGKIKAGSVCNDIVQHHDWLPTFLAIAGAPDVVDKLKKGYKAIGRTYKNHIDGFNLLPYLTGKEKEGPRTSSSTSATTATCSACATTTGSWCSWNSARPARCASGPIHLRGCACPSCSTCAPIRMSSRHDVELVLRMVPVQRLFHLCRPGGGSEVRGDLQGVPAGAEAEYLHCRRRAGEDA